MELKYIVLGVVAVVIVFFIRIYNNLIKLRNRFKNSFAQIDVQLKRRHDLIPNLVNTAKGYMKHEQETLEGVIQARNAAVSSNERVAQDPTNEEAVKELSAKENQLSGMLRQVFALSENYPDLKANTNMQNLMEEISSTENKISFARQAYNDSVTDYNNATQVFPNNLAAGMFNFKQATLLEIEDQKERQNVEVKF